MPCSDAVSPTVQPASEPDQQQEGEGPQQTLLEVSTKEGSKERSPWRLALCGRAHMPGSGDLLGCSPAVALCSEKSLMTPEGPLKDSEVRSIDGSG